MNKMIKRKQKEVDDFLKDVDYSSSPLLVDLLDKHCLFFDSEFKALMKIISNANDIVKRIYKRFDRRETIQIAPSVARYVELDNEVQRYPHLLYSFTSRNVRICIVKIKSNYHILCLNYTPKNCVKTLALRPRPEDSRLLGSWFSLVPETIECWLDVVFEYCSHELEVLF